MKRIICFVVILIIGLSNTALAELQINEKGELREKIETSSWRDLTETERQAVETGKEVMIGSPVVTREKVGFFHYVIVSTYTQICVLDTMTNTLVMKQNEIGSRGEPMLAVHTVLILLAICLMIGSNYFKGRNKSSARFALFAFLAAAASYSFALAAAVLFSSTTIATFTLFAAIASTFAILTVKPNLKQIYNTNSALFYIFSGIALFI